MGRCKHLNFSISEQVHAYSEYTYRNGQWLDDAIGEHSDPVGSGLLIFVCEDCGLKRECRGKLPKYFRERWNALREFQSRRTLRERQ